MMQTKYILATTVIAILLLSLSILSKVSNLNKEGDHWSDFDVVQSMVARGGGLLSSSIPSSSSCIGDIASCTGETVDLQPRRPQHDNSSLTSYMWCGGKPYNPRTDQRPAVPDDDQSLVIDAVSVGTKFAVPQMEAQAATWASHKSMRYLFGMTEDDDADPLCHEAMTEDQYHKFFKTCITKQYPGSRIKGIRRQMPTINFMLRHNKTKGWVCAQQRFAHAMGKVGRFYQRDEGPLPDYLFIQDDDTWFGMDGLTSFLATKASRTIPFVTAGCHVEWPFHIVNFSFPFGGFGMMLNRVSIERLIKPIYCQNQTASTDAHTQKVCFRLQEDIASERMAFKEGMSISELMDRHAAMHPYRSYERWGDPGYCMCGDWVLGYYANYYELGSRENAHLDFVHIDKSIGYHYKEPTGECRNHGPEHCLSAKEPKSCHRMTPGAMAEMHARNASRRN